MAERVLVDTSAAYALFSASDLFHDRAGAAYRSLMAREEELWATSYTLVETIALLHRRLGFEVVSEFSEWYRANLQVLWIDGRLHAEAWNRFVTDRGRTLSFVDWITVVASYDMGFPPVFTFDSGFANQGLPVVPR